MPNTLNIGDATTRKETLSVEAPPVINAAFTPNGKQMVKLL
jgi:hypothetical protein